MKCIDLLERDRERDGRRWIIIVLIDVEIAIIETLTLMLLVTSNVDHISTSYWPCSSTPPQMSPYRSIDLALKSTWISL